MPRTFKRTAPPLAKYRQIAEAAVALVERLRAASPDDTIHGPLWKSGMLAHYHNRAERILSQPPRGAQAFAKGLLARLNRK